VAEGALFALAIQQPVAGLSPKRASAMARLELGALDEYFNAFQKCTRRFYLLKGFSAMAAQVWARCRSTPA
jgi:hypothetical protein